MLRIPATPSRVLVLSLASALLVAGFGQPSALAARQPKITWSEKKVVISVPAGGSVTKNVSFTSDQNIQNASIEAVPSIAPFLTIQPESVASIFPDQAQSVVLAVSVPAGTAVGKRQGTIHLRQGSSTIPELLKVDIDIGPEEAIEEAKDDSPVVSPAKVSLSGVSESAFNSPTATFRFDISEATLSVDPSTVSVFVNDFPIDPANIQITPNVVTVSGFLYDGPNQLTFLAQDDKGNLIYKSASLWAGYSTLNVATVDENGQPLDGVMVTARLGDNKEVSATAVSANGTVTFVDLPNRTIILDASASGNRIGSTAVAGSDWMVQVEVRGFKTASSVDNNDFRQGADGWETGSAPVTIVPHEEGVFVPLEVPPTGDDYFEDSPAMASPSISMTSSTTAAAAVTSRAERHARTQTAVPSAVGMGPASSAPVTATTVLTPGANEDLVLKTQGEGPQTLSRTFQVDPGTQEVKIRYKFVTTEVPGGYFGTRYNDYFNLTFRSQTEQGAGSESQTMNGLGISAFDKDGNTQWREFSLPVNVDGDTVQLDATVANVSDGYLDSQLVMDVVSTPKVRIDPLTAVVKNNSATVLVKMSSTNPITATLKLITREGTDGSAQFASGGGTSLTINATTAVEIKGITESSTRDNIRLEAHDATGAPLNSEDFSVVWVTLSLRTSGSFSPDNEAATNGSIERRLGTTTLGTFQSSGFNTNAIWRTGMEYVGTVAPSDFHDKVTLTRTVTGRVRFSGNVLKGSSGASEDPTKVTSFRDDDPQPKGHVYDFDAPGVTNGTLATPDSVRRQRVNFKEFALYNGVKASDDLLTFSRISVRKTTSGEVLATDVTGDNIAGTGSTALTWDLR